MTSSTTQVPPAPVVTSRPGAFDRVVVLLPYCSFTLWKTDLGTDSDSDPIPVVGTENCS